MKTNYDLPAPMTCQEYDPKHLTNPFIALPKLQGIFGMLVEGRVYSRQRKELVALRGQFPVWPSGVILYGELYVHGWTQQRIYGAVMRDEPTIDTREVKLFLFDVFNEEPYRIRLLRLQSYSGSNTPLILYEWHREIPNLVYEQHIDAGYEGTIYRDPEGLYEPGIRSWSMMKRKPWKDMDVTIIGKEEGKGKFRGKLGRFVCRMQDGQTIKVGGGHITEAERESFWIYNLSKDVINIKYQYLSDSGIPIHPQFVAFR